MSLDSVRFIDTFIETVSKYCAEEFGKLFARLCTLSMIEQQCLILCPY